MTFYKQKGWWKSRTVWTGIATSVFGLLALFGLVPVGLDGNAIVEAIMAVVGVLVVWFRGTATEEIAPVTSLGE